MTTSLCSIGFIDDTLQWISSKPSSAGVLTVTGEPLSDLSFVIQIEGLDSMASDNKFLLRGGVCIRKNDSEFCFVWEANDFSVVSDPPRSNRKDGGRCLSVPPCPIFICRM